MKKYFFIFIILSIFFISCRPFTEIYLKEKTTGIRKLSISKGILFPDFSRSVYSYTIEVDNSVDSITINCVLLNDKSEVIFRMNDKIVRNPISIEPGLNKICIVITAEDDISICNYTLNVIRNIGLTPTPTATPLPTIAGCIYLDKLNYACNRTIIASSGQSTGYDLIDQSSDTYWQSDLITVDNFSQYIWIIFNEELTLDSIEIEWNENYYPKIFNIWGSDYSDPLLHLNETNNIEEIQEFEPQSLEE